MPKISVIIPVYNVEKYLPQCLDSVLAQTFDDWEMICVNDGSPDNCGKILSAYAQKDKRIRVISQKNQGQSVARNRGLDVATGRWICFLDSDDALPNYAFKCLYDIAEQTKSAVVASRARFIMGSDIKKMNVPVAPYKYKICHGGFKDFVRDPKIFSAPWNKLFQAKLFKYLRFPEGMIFEDWPLMTLLFGQVESYVTTETPCYIYRESNTSTTRSVFSAHKVDCYIRGIRIVYQGFQSTPQSCDAQKRIVVAVKMLVNKVYKARNKDLAKYTFQQVNQLFSDGIILSHMLPLKTRYRLWRLKHL